MQFYTSDFAVLDKGAWKKIHGSSSTVGDGYGPGSTLYFPLILRSSPDQRYADLTAAAFVEFHAPLAAGLHLLESRGPTGDGTLLASGEVYNNFGRMDVWYKGSDSN